MDLSPQNISAEQRLKSINPPVAAHDRFPRKEGGWVRYSKTSSVVVVFLHGFLSNAADCWRHRNGAYWPEILANDRRFGDISIYTSSYHTEVSSRDYGLADCAEEVLAGLIMRPQGNGIAPIEFPNILFVCHSFGGLVCRSLVERHPSKFSAKSLGFLLLASPSLGSPYANAGECIAQLFKNKAAMQLTSKSDLVVDLDRRFMQFLEDYKGRVAGIEGIETNFYSNKLLSFIFPLVVPWESGARYFGSAQRIPKTDHSSIVKPQDDEHPSHRLLLNFYNEKFGKIIQQTEQSSAKNIIHALSQTGDRHVLSCALFDIYDIRCEEFYFVRNIDQQLQSALEVYAVWLHGSSGIGKTCLLKRHLTKNNFAPIELQLGHLSLALTPERCIEEIAATCTQMSEDDTTVRPTINGISNFLIERARHSSIVLYLDEVPISKARPNEIRRFVQLIASLLDAIKQRVGANVRFIISSIEEPTLDGNSKLNEQMMSLAVSEWNNDDLTQLYEKITSQIIKLRVQKDFVQILIDACSGSPRFLKTFLRNRFLATPETADIAVLERTRNQFDWRNS